MFAYTGAEGVELRLDATEIQVCRPIAGVGEATVGVAVDGGFAVVGLSP
ncbi:hypothetical protein ACJ6WE_30505 [Streptomyces sp. MMS24-I31]